MTVGPLCTPSAALHSPLHSVLAFALPYPSSFPFTPHLAHLDIIDLGIALVAHRNFAFLGTTFFGGPTAVDASC